MAESSKRTPEAPELDATDRKIIELLLADARMSNSQLAEALGVAPSTALLRTRQLRERGIIEGFSVRLDLKKLGRSVQALISVRLRAHDREEIDRFMERAPKLPEVLSTFHVTGAEDYLLHIAVDNTDDLRDWVLDNLTTDPAVGHTETTLVFEQRSGYAGPL